MASKDDFVISFSDLPYLFKRHKKKFLITVVVFTLFGFYWGITSKPYFEAKGTFRESTKPGSLGSEKSVLLLAGSNKSNSDAIPIMQSNLIVEEAIKKTRLQALVVPKENFTNLQIAKKQLASFFSRLLYKKPAKHEDEEYALEAETDFIGDLPVNINLEFISENDFVWQDQESNKKGKGRIGEIINDLGFNWKIIKEKEVPLKGLRFNLGIQPLYPLILFIQDILKFETSTDSQSFAYVKARFPNRKKAKDLVNAVMDSYVDYITRKQKQIAKKQIAYLQKRENDLGQELSAILEEHANKISGQFINTGFSNSEQLMQFLAKSEENYKTQLLKIDLDLRLLKELGKSSGGNPAVGKELDTLGQQKDMLSIALKNASTFEKQQPLDRLIENLASVRDLLKETKELISALNSNTPLPKTPLLDAYPAAGVAAWKSKVSEDEEGGSLRLQFSKYLEQMARFFQIEEKTLAAKLSHTQDLSEEFGSLDLEGTMSLIKRFTEELQAIESNIGEKEFYIKEIALDDSHLTALTTASNDPTLQQIGKRTTEILLAKYDTENRSAKEQERLNHEISLQRTFLKNHLLQTKKILGLKRTLLQEKVTYLQKMALNLIEQRIAILHKRIEDQNRSQMIGLEKERDLLEDHQKKLRLPASEISENWVREKGLDQKLLMHRRMIEEVSRMVESQNIASNLEVLQSGPIDRAAVPLSPRFFPFILYTMVGAFVGALCGSFVVLGKSLAEGVEATPKNLLQSGEAVAGIITKNASHLSELSKEELDALRVSWHLLEKGGHRVFAVSLDEKSRLPLFLSELLSKRDKKTLLVDLASLKNGHKEHSISFWEWIESNDPIPQVEKPLTVFSCSENPPYAAETVLSSSFDKKVNLLAEHFDYIVFAATRSSLQDPLLFALLQKLQSGLIVLTAESLENIQRLKEETDANLGFLFAL